MADLQETLNKRERRSRITAFVIGLGIIFVLVVLFIGFSSNSDEANTNDGDNTGQVADSDANGENVFDVLDEEGSDTAGEEETGQVSSDSTENESGEVAGETDSATTNTADDGLPNTGPAETAFFGVLTLVIAGYYYARSQRTLKNTTLNK